MDVFENALKIAHDLCDKNEHELLYLTKHGSHLYGTNTPSSDHDFKGIFLPNINNVILGKRKDSLSFKTNKNDRNTKDDVDLELYSLQFWVNTLVKNGETEGIELLYSHTNRDAVLFINPKMEEILFNKTILFNPKNCQAFIGFAISHAKTYFKKSERFGVIKNIYDYVTTIHSGKSEYKLKDVFDDIITKFYHPTYCIEVNTNEIRSMEICGKIHQETILLGEFINRLRKSESSYGHRTRTAADMNNKDWKSLSSALKALFEVESLFEQSSIQFPFIDKQRELLLDIKNGVVDYDDVDRIINEKIDRVDELKKVFFVPFWDYNEVEVVKLFKGIYNI